MMPDQFVSRCPSPVSGLGPYPGWFSALLSARGIDTPEAAERFLAPSPEGLHDPFLLPGMDRTVALLKEAVAKGDTILVWGDYDVDGICAASILMDVLHEMGASLAYRIPSRHSEGYGLNEAGIREIAGKCRLLVTVDCGITSVKEVALAKELGLTVIVTDHHQPPEELPAADAVMDPLLGDYPFPSLCGAGVALKICQALRGMPGVMKRLDLAALATVADVVPLLDENRIIVREGLSRIPASPRPGLQALLRVAGIRGPLTSDDIAFRLAPRLNAAGRLGDAKLAVHLLLTPDPAKADCIAGLLENENRRRQDLEKKMVGEARRQAESAGPEGAHVLVVQGADWNPGVIGLAAGKLCEMYHLPVVALSVRDGAAVGSCRSIPGVHIFRMLAACGDLLERFGGHEQAAGLSVKEEKIPALKARLEEQIASSVPAECFLRTREYDLALPFGTWTEETLSLLDALEPTGCGNPAPLFRMEGAEALSLRRVGRDGSHLKLTLRENGSSPFEGIAFSLGSLADTSPQKLDLLYRPVRNEFRGRTAIEAQVAAIHPV